MKLYRQKKRMQCRFAGMNRAESAKQVIILKKHFTTERTEITEEEREVTIIDGSTKKVNYVWCSNSLVFFANFASLRE
jgi:hypothetical protein